MRCAFLPAPLEAYQSFFSDLQKNLPSGQSIKLCEVRGVERFQMGSSENTVWPAADCTNKLQNAAAIRANQILKVCGIPLGFKEKALLQILIWAQMQRVRKDR